MLYETATAYETSAIYNDAGGAGGVVLPVFMYHYMQQGLY